MIRAGFGRVDMNRGAIDRHVRDNPRFMTQVGNTFRDEARNNAKGVGLAGKRSDAPEMAIIAVPGSDGDGLFVDVGYSRHHPGFYLWWWEFGTKNHSPRPHLRPALKPGLIS